MTTFGEMPLDACQTISKDKFRIDWLKCPSFGSNLMIPKPVGKGFVSCFCLESCTFLNFDKVTKSHEPQKQKTLAENTETCLRNSTAIEYYLWNKNKKRTQKKKALLSLCCPSPNLQNHQQRTTQRSTRSGQIEIARIKIYMISGIQEVNSSLSCNVKISFWHGIINWTPPKKRESLEKGLLSCWAITKLYLWLFPLQQHVYLLEYDLYTYQNELREHRC